MQCTLRNYDAGYYENDIRGPLTFDIGSIPNKGRIPLEKLIECVDRLGPCSYRDIEDDIGMSKSCISYNVEKLGIFGIRKTRVPAIGKGGRRTNHKASDLLGELCENTSPRVFIWYKRNPRQRSELIEIFKRGILSNGPLDADKRRALTRLLDPDEDEIFYDLYDWYSNL